MPSTPCSTRDYRSTRSAISQHQIWLEKRLVDEAKGEFRLGEKLYDEKLGYALFSSLYALPGRIVASQSGRIVESAARSADAGGIFSGLPALFAGVPPESYASAFEKSGVTPAALASGYAAFFLYSFLIGLFAIVLTIKVARAARQ